MRSRSVAHGAATILLPSPLLYLTKTTYLGLGEGVGGADWVVFGPGCPLEFPQELTKICVQVPPSGIELTGLGRCLHLSFLFCCLVRGDFVQKEDCKAGGDCRSRESALTMRFASVPLFGFCILFLTLPVTLAAARIEHRCSEPIIGILD